MNTTLNKIRRFKPCRPSWTKLLEGFYKLRADDEPLSLITILDILDIEDAVWCLRTFDYLDYCLFLADIIESVLHIYERNNRSAGPRNTMNAIREYKKGNITKEELQKVADAVDCVTDGTSVAYAAFCAADADAVDCAVDCILTVDEATDAITEKWKEIEQLFIKHFGEKS